MDVDTFLKDTTSLPCTCASSTCKDDHHGHVVSGDLKIVTNSKLRKLLSRGRKFREVRSIDWDVAQATVFEGFDTFVQEWSQKHNLGLEILKP